MFLSRIELNEYRKETMRALSSPQVMHAAVMASFPAFDKDSGGRVLWRIDCLGKTLYLLVMSPIRPDFTHIVEQFGRPASDQKWDTVDYDEHIDSMKQGSVVRFRLRANPTHSQSVEGSRGKVCHHVTAEQQMGWLKRKSADCGFTVDSEDGSLGAEIVQRELVTFLRQGRKVTISMVTFEGVLKVTDEELFRKTMIGGVGRAKAYGCGLMTTIRI